MNAIVLPFPPRVVETLASLARAANHRWPGVNAPMVGVAIEMLDQPTAELRAKVRAIVDQGADGLLDKTDRALAETAADLGLMVEAIDLARQKLRAATLAQKDDAHG